MTIAAAVFCIDGVAVAADSREGYGDTHTYVDKLETFNKEGHVAIVAGSGGSYLLDYMTPRICGLVYSAKSAID